MADLIQIGIDVKTNIKQATADLDKMGGSVLQNVQTFNRLENEVKQLNSALAKGRVNEAAYAKGMKQINGELAVFQQRAAKAAQVERKFGAAAASGGKSMNRFNVALQQGGFQLQDFAVQMQSGTSFFTAFAQQGSQFAGIFGPTGAVVGAVIAVGSAVAGGLVNSLMGASEEVDNLSDSLKNYKDLSEQIADSKGLSEEFGDLASQAKIVLSALKEIESISIQKQISELGGIGKVIETSELQRTGSTLYGLIPTFEKVSMLSAKQVQKAVDFLGATEGTFGEIGSYAGQYVRLLQEIQSAGTMEDQADSAGKLSQFLKEHVETRGEEVENLEQIQALQEILLSLMSAANVEDKDKLETQKAYNEELERTEEISKAISENNQDVGRRLEIAKAETDVINEVMGAEDALGKLRATYARADYLSKMLSKGIAGDELTTAMDNYDVLVEQLKVKEAANKAAKEAARENKDNLAAQTKAERKAAATAAKAKAEAQKLLDLTAKISASTPYEPMTALQIEAAKAQAEMVKVFETSMDLKEELGEGAYEALRLAGVDMTSGIDEAAKAAAILAANLNLSLAQAQAIQNMGGGRGGDPREMGGRTIDWNTRAAIAYEDALKNITKTTKKTGATTKKTLTDAEKAAKAYADALDGTVVSAIGSVADAWGDFVVRGFKDFKGFANAVLDSFKSMIANMIAMAAKNQIMLSLGIGGVGAGMATGAAAGSVGGTAGSSLLSGGGMLAGTATGTALAGISGGFQAALGIGGYSSAGLFSVGANAATASAATGASALATSLGAIAGPLLAVVAIVAFFKKKVKELDSGLQGTVTTLDATIESFSKIKTSRFFGLSKKVSTSSKELSEEEIEPFVKAAQEIQMSVLNAAESLNISKDVFDNFSYDFKLSLKGLSEEAASAAISEEFIKMGDAFAYLSGHFETMNELLAVAQQRYDLEIRKLQALGDTEALLAHQREIELANVHDLNRELLIEIHALEDLAMAVDETTGILGDAREAFNLQARALQAMGDAEGLLALRRQSELENVNELNKELLLEVHALEDLAMAVESTTSEAEKMTSALEDASSAVEDAASELQDLLDESLDAALGGLERAIDARKDAIYQKFDSLISGLQDRLSAADNTARASSEIYSILSGALEGRSLAGASFAGRESARAYVSGGGTDAERLQSAVNTLSEPSAQLFSSFEDYARDFALTSNVLKDSKDAAEAQMTADEQAVVLLEKQIEQADKDRNDQLRVLDEQLEAAILQIDTLKGIDTSILSVDAAMQTVRDAMTTYEQTQANHSELNSSVLTIQQAINNLAGAVQAQAAAQAAAAAASQAQAAAQAQVAAAQEKLAIAQSGAQTDVNSTAASISRSEAAAISSTIPMSAAEQAMLNRFSGGERPDHIKRAIAEGKRYDPSVGGYRKFAMGGYHTGGLRMVGETGPELEVTGPSRIYSASQTKGMMSNPELVAEIKELRREISDTKTEQRAASIAMVKYNKRTSDQLRTWNSVGLPQERTN